MMQETSGIFHVDGQAGSTTQRRGGVFRQLFEV